MPKKPFAEIDEYFKSSAVRRAIRPDQEPLIAAVQTEFPAIEAFRNYLLEQFKKYPYPYPEERKSRRTLFDHLQSFHLLDALLTEPVLLEIRVALFLFEVDQREREPEQADRLKFHRNVLHSIFRHIQAIRGLLNENRVDVRWMARYLRAADEQMVQEAQAIYPLYPYVVSRRGSPAPTVSSREMLLWTYDVVSGALIGAGLRRGRKELAIQLTAIICSPSHFLHTVPVTPDAVRKHVERYRH
jgi:hypothetical protein